MAQPQSPQQLTRRTALVWAAGVGIGVPVLNACGGGGDAGGGSMGYGAPDAAASPSGGATSATASGEAQAGGGAGGRELVRLADVPVGGAVAAEDAAGEPVIVARPGEDEVVAFSAICTHRGCTVAPADGILRCPCHGSTFDPATGENTGGPAPEPLAEVAVRIDGESVVEG